MAEQGARSSGNYPGNQRPGAFGSKINLSGKARVSRKDVEALIPKGKKPRRKKK